MSGIRGLTLHRPWTWAILHAGKRVENRGWPPPARQLPLGDLIALHAGKTWDADGAAWIRDEFDVQPVQERAGTIVGVARLIGWSGPAGTNLQSERRAEVDAALQSEWLFGPYGWVLGDVATIEPIPWKGALGLWCLPDDLRAEVLTRYAAARQEVPHAS